MNREAAPTSATTFSRTAVFILFLGATGIGFAPLFVRLSETGPIATAFWRVGLSAPLLWLGVWLSERQGTGPRPLTRSHYRWLAVAGISFAADLSVWHYSIQYTSIANATLLPNLTPVIVTLGAWFFFRQSIRPLFLAGMAIALAGAAVLLGESLSVSMVTLKGDVLAMSTAVFYAIYLLITKHLRQHTGSLRFMAWVSTVCALILLPIMLLSGEQQLPATLYGGLMLLGLAWLSHAGGQGLIAQAMAGLPATFSSVSLLWQPVVAALLAWGLLDEALSVWQMLGGLIVLVGIFVAGRGSQ